MRAMDSNDERYKEKPLIIPAQINTEEIERVRALLLDAADALQQAADKSKKKPKTALREYVSCISTVMSVMSAAEIQGFRSWIAVGMPKSELARLTSVSRATIDNRVARSKNESFDSSVERAEARHKEMMEHSKEEERKEEQPAEPAKTDEKSAYAEESTSASYSESDYEDI